MIDRNRLGQLMMQLVMAVEQASPIPRWEDVDEDDREAYRGAGEAFARELLGPRRTLHARVSLYGHLDLGTCRVEETMLAGQDMLRITSLTGDGSPQTHWTRAASIYCMSEMTEAEAQAEMRAYQERKSENERRGKAAAIARAERRETARAARAGFSLFVVEMTRSGDLELRCVPTSPDATTGFAACGINDLLCDIDEEIEEAHAEHLATTSLDDPKRYIGFRIIAGGSRAAAVAEACAALGFDAVHRQREADHERDRDRIDF